MRHIIDDFIAPPCHVNYELVYEDANVLVVNKPSGLLGLSGKNPANADSLHYRLSHDFGAIYLVHRLDFGTSGLLVVARNKVAVRLLNAQFQQNTIYKRYTARVRGVVLNEQLHIELPIARDDANFPRMQISHSLGKPAYTRLQVLERDRQSNTTRVDLYPKTGRTHQLRIHCSAIGYPIMGCDIYGGTQPNEPKQRLMLHAQALRFEHPNTGRAMEFEVAAEF